MDVTRTWKESDYLRYADGRLGNKIHPGNSLYKSVTKIYDGVLQETRRTHKSHFNEIFSHDHDFNMKRSAFQSDFNIETHGKSHLRLFQCTRPSNKKRRKRSFQYDDDVALLKKFTKDSLMFRQLHLVKGNNHEQVHLKTVYELLRCHWDPAVTKSELNKCVKELHVQAKKHNSTFQIIVTLAQSLSHQNLSTWGALVGCLVVKNDEQTQRVLADLITTENPRQLTDTEFDYILEAVYFLPSGPLFPRLIESLLSVHENKNGSRHTEVSHMAMLVISALVKKCCDAGYNTSLPDFIFERLRNSFVNHPHRRHEEASETHQSYLRNHLWAFGNLGHISSLNIVTSQLDSDNSVIRLSAVTALRKLPTSLTDHLLLEVLKREEHVSVKTAVIRVIMERGGNINEELRNAIEDALWKTEEKDEFDLAILQLLENTDDHTSESIKLLRQRRVLIHQRKKRAFLPILKPREFILGPKKEWSRKFGGKYASVEAGVKFINQVKLRIGIFGGKFELDLDNAAIFAGNVFSKKFNIIDGKAAFKFAASFKNDIPKDLIHNIVDVIDSSLSKVDALKSIFLQHIENFISKLKNYLPLNVEDFTTFIEQGLDFAKRISLPIRFGNHFRNIANFLHDFLAKSDTWNRISHLVKSMMPKLKNLEFSAKPFMKTKKFLQFLKNAIDLVTKNVPHELPIQFEIRDFLDYISQNSGPLSKKIDGYFATIDNRVPTNLYNLLHFKDALNFPHVIKNFTKLALRLLKFGNSFLRMDDVLLGLSTTQIHQKVFNSSLNLEKQTYFNENHFSNLPSIITAFGNMFETFEDQTVDLEAFFSIYLVDVKRTFEHLKLFPNQTNPYASTSQWFRSNIYTFRKVLMSLDHYLINQSEQSGFFEEKVDIVKLFKRTSLKKICNLQNVIQTYSRDLREFGEEIETDALIVINNVEQETLKVVKELSNVTTFIEMLTNSFKANLSKMAEEFASKSVDDVDKLLKDVKDVGDDVSLFLDSTTTRFTGLCHNSVNISGKVLDHLQEAVQNAVAEISLFLHTHSELAIGNVTAAFKQVVKKVITWHKDYLEKHLGKISGIFETIDEVLSLLKNKTDFWRNVYDIWETIGGVIKHLANFPEYAQAALSAADKVKMFASNAKIWINELNKLNWQRSLGIEFDDRFRSLCKEFQSFGSDLANQIKGESILNNLKRFVRDKIKLLISNVVAKLETLKGPLKYAENQVLTLSHSVGEVSSMIKAVRPFSEKISPILNEIRRLPNCSELRKISNSMITNCTKSSKGFSKTAYNDYKKLLSNLEGIMTVMPHGWRDMYLDTCVDKGACLSDIFIKQAVDISKSLKKVGSKLQMGLFRNLHECHESFKPVVATAKSIEAVITKIKEFNLDDEVKQIRHICERITGWILKFGKRKQIMKRSSDIHERNFENLAERIRQANNTKKTISSIIEDVFEKLKNIFDEEMVTFVHEFDKAKKSLQMGVKISEKSGVLTSNLHALENVTADINDFIRGADLMVGSLKGTIFEVFAKISGFSDIFYQKLKGYGEKIAQIARKVNGFLDTVYSFLNTIQLRQKGLDIRDYKKWNEYPYCSENICLRPLGRSSELYRKRIFPWKYPHLDDLSSLKNTGKWLTPGLFDDYKVRGIAHWSKTVVLLGMQGVALNQNKPSLLVIVDISSDVSVVLKLFQVSENDKPFTGQMGGIVIIKPLYVWFSSAKYLFAVQYEDIKNSMETTGPSMIRITKRKQFAHNIYSVSFDQNNQVIWAVDKENSKAYSYRCDATGDIGEKVKTLDTESHACSLSIVRQFGVDYACIAKCTLKAGYQCRLEFHSLDTETVDTRTLHRVVRTPSGLQAVQTVNSETMMLAFSSGTFNDKDKIQRIGGDFEDRFFKIKLPILKTNLSVTENCLYLKIGGNYIIPARRLLPVGKLKCGTQRESNTDWKGFFDIDVDVYTEELELKRGFIAPTPPESVCDWTFDSKPREGSHDFVPERDVSWSILGISVGFFFGVRGHYHFNYRISLCLDDKRAKLSLIPGAWVSVYGGAKLSILIASVGVTIEGNILETYLIPEINVRIDRWPLEACIALKIHSTPLSFRFSVWYKIGLCGTITIFGWISFDISLGMCEEKSLVDWSWSAPAIEKVLFSTCRNHVDETAPENGECTAMQIGDKSYLLEWSGFTEDTKIQNYTVIVGSLAGSGDDFYKVVGLRQSLLIENLEIMHGRLVYAAVYAVNSAGLEGPIVGCPTFPARRKPPTVIFIHDGESLQDIDYQSDPTSIAMNYQIKENFTEIASIQWGVSSFAACTLTPDETEVLSLTDLGENLSVKKHLKNLKNGATYYVRVVVTNHLGLSTVACSDGVLIDATPPVPQRFSVGRNGFVASLNIVRGKFDDFLDKESPMTRYEWKLFDQTIGKGITEYSEIRLTQRAPMLDRLNLTAGQKYMATLKGTNAAGLSSEVKVFDIIPDDTPPVCDGPIIDVISKKDSYDIDFVGQTINLTARFACYDNESGINLTEAAVGTYPGGQNILNFTDVRYLLTDVINDLNIKTVTFTNLSLSSMSRYYITIRSKNNIGLFKTLWTDGILIDTTRPTVLPLYIRDGIKGLDKRFSKDNIMFPAHWENAFADADSDIAEYYVGLGSSPGQDNIVRFRSYGKETRAFISSSNLRSGITYFVTVIGCNHVNMCVNASSNGAMVDFTPPNAGIVYAGMRSPAIEITWINKGAWAHWNWCSADRNGSDVTSDTCNSSSFYDINSGIKNFGLTVFSYEFAKVLKQVKTVGRVDVSGIDVCMPNGLFSMVVEAADRAGILSGSISRPFIVDSTPPSITDIYHGKENSKIKYINTTVYKVEVFFEIVEDVSHIVFYSLGVGSYIGGNDIKSFVNYNNTFLSNRLRFNWTDSESITLMHGMKYYITIKAINAAGLISVLSSNSLLCDTKQPQILNLFDGWKSEDNDLHRFPNIYRMHWRLMTDISGIKETKVCLTSLANNATCDIHPIMVIPNTEMSFLFSNLKLHPGMNVFAMLQLTDNAGNLASYWSDGSIVDTTPPVTGRVIHGRPGEHRQWQREVNILYASWSGFSDAESSIHHYELAFGTQPGMSDIQAFTNVGLVAFAASSNLAVTELKNGVMYYASVVAYNNAGIASRVVTSDGILVDTVPPIFTQTPYDGTIFGVDSDYSRDGTSLSVNWKCGDKGSGVNQVLVGFGTQPGRQDVAQFKPVLPYQMFYKATNLKLISGQMYFSMVKCINNMGLQASAGSNGLVFDSTPPVILSLNNGRYAYSHVHYTDGVSPVFVNWKTYDAESHITSISVEIKNRKSESTASGPLYVHVTDTSFGIPIQKQLKQGEDYFVMLTVKNGAGLTAQTGSGSFMVDNTAPACSNVYVVDSHGYATKFIHSEKNIAIHFQCYDPESGISQYRFAIEDFAFSRVIFPFHQIEGVTPSSSVAAVGGLGKRTLKLIHNSIYRVIIRAQNGAKVTKEYWSPKVKVDLTSPVLTNVTASFDVLSESLKVIWKMSDEESGIKAIFWALKKLSHDRSKRTPTNFTKISKDLTEVIISTRNFDEGVIYSVQLKVVNMAGMSVMGMSNGVIFDRTPPTPGIVTATLILPTNHSDKANIIHNVTFATKWNSFIDKESPIMSYKWAIGLSHTNTKLKSDRFDTSVPFEHTNGYLIKNQAVLKGNSYYVCIRVANVLGIEQTSCSDSILVKIGKFSVGVISDGPFTEDIDFQLDDKAVRLHWDDFRDPVYGLQKYTWCYGLVENNNTDNVSCISPMTNVYPLLTTSASLFHNVTLIHGKRYAVKVKAFNNKGQSVTAVSDGFIIDRTAPLVEFLSIAGSEIDDTVYISTPHSLEITWSMNEPESVIDKIIFSIGSLPHHDDLLHPIILDRNQRSVDIEKFNLTLENGMSFFVNIIGKNILGLSRQIVSPQIIADFTPPYPGEVMDGNDAKDVDYQADNSRLYVSWYGSHDQESDLVDFMYCVGTEQGKTGKTL